MDLKKIQQSMTRERVTAFLADLGIDPNDVCELRVYPNRVILTRYLNDDDGKRVLDHLGPRTVESHFSVID